MSVFNYNSKKHDNFTKIEPFSARAVCNIFSCPSPPQQYMLFLVLIAAVSALMAWENCGHRTCVLDGERTQYMSVINNNSVMTGNLHNVYIRLKAQKHGKRLFQLLVFFFKAC